MDILKKYKYLFLLIGGLILFVIGSFVGLIITYCFAYGKYGLDFKTFYNGLYFFTNYFSDIAYNETMTLAQYAEIYFTENPVLFEQIKVLSSINQFTSYLPILIFIFVFLINDLKEDFIKLKKDLLRNFLVFVIGSAVLLIASLVIATIYEAFGDTGQSDNESIIGLIIEGKGIVLMLISVVFIAPFVEEILFRKLIIDSCEKHFHLKPVFAIMISALIFAFIHVSDAENIKYIFQYLAMAVPLCLTYHFSKNNVFVSTLVHFGNNLLVAISYIIVLYAK